MNWEVTLLEKINTLKLEMIESGTKNGLNHPSTLQMSQELDALIHEVMVLTQKN